MKVSVTLGDITKFEGDAIVNAANCTLLGGGGVDGAIHRAAGPKLLLHCMTLGGCRTGEAKITPGFKLAAKYIIHTPGPRYTSMTQDAADEKLRDCYWNSLTLAEQNECRTVAFPSISTGIYRFPLERAAAIVARTLSEYAQTHDSGIEEVTMVCFDQTTYEAYRAAFEKEELGRPGARVGISR